MSSKDEKNFDEKNAGGCGCNDGVCSSDDCNCATDESCGDDCNCMNDIKLEEGVISGEELLLESSEFMLLKKRNEFLESEIKIKEDELLRKAADLDNYRKRLIKESDDKVRYSNQSLVADFIPMIDNIELTISYVKPDDNTLKEGLELTLKAFKDKLSKYGVKEISCEVGTKFDPQFHEALIMDKSAEFEDNTITLCVQRGYTLNDRVIRAAKVKVNKL